MIYRDDITTEQWQKIHGLPIQDFLCPRCKEIFKVNRPFISKDYAGFESPIHSCGWRYTGVTSTPISDESRKIWSEIF